MATTDELEQQIVELTHRVQALEDERAVHRTLVRYGFAVDSGDPEATADLYTDTCVIELDTAGGTRLDGRAGAASIVDNETHQSLIPGCAHLLGPFSVEVEGEHAVATGYAMVVRRHGDAFEIWREGCGRWELHRVDGRWRIARRTSIAIGNDGAQELLHRDLPVPPG